MKSIKIMINKKDYINKVYGCWFERYPINRAQFSWEER